MQKMKEERRIIVKIEIGLKFHRISEQFAIAISECKHFANVTLIMQQTPLQIIMFKHAGSIDSPRCLNTHHFFQAQL